MATELPLVVMDLLQVMVPELEDMADTDLDLAVRDLVMQDMDLHLDTGHTHQPITLHLQPVTLHPDITLHQLLDTAYTDLLLMEAMVDTDHMAVMMIT